MTEHREKALPRFDDVGSRAEQLILVSLESRKRVTDNVFMGSLKCQGKGGNVIHREEQEIRRKSILNCSSTDLCYVKKSEISLDECQWKTLNQFLCSDLGAWPKISNLLDLCI